MAWLSCRKVQLLCSKRRSWCIMGCSCASNVAGGGAVANAEAEGVTLESVLAQAQAVAN